MDTLFSPFILKNLALKNRVVMPPMCTYCADLDGRLTPWHLLHYGTRAAGGTGLIIIEATAVCPEGRITADSLGLWENEQMDGLRALVDLLHENGAMVGIQLNHAGRKCVAMTEDIEAPSPIPYDDGKSRRPREMSAKDIEDTVEEFRMAAARAAVAGVDLIELHGAHGYLISEFLSPLSNQRGDEYGGSPENRARFLGRVMESVRRVWPEDKALCLRVSAEDYAEGGIHPEDMAALLNLVKDKGLDLVNVSTGGVVSVAPPTSRGYQLPQARIIRELTGLPVMGGGLLWEPEEVNAAVATGQTDLVYLGRELLRNPYWPLQAAEALGQDFPWPPQYERARRPL